MTARRTTTEVSVLGPLGVIVALMGVVALASHAPKQAAATASTASEDAASSIPQANGDHAASALRLGGPMDINQATADELRLLPGIGPKLAEKIIAHRARKRFDKPQDLLDVRGIGPVKLQRLLPLIHTKPFVHAESPVHAELVAAAKSRATPKSKSAEDPPVRKQARH